MQRNPVYELHAQANGTIGTENEYDYPAWQNRGQEQTDHEQKKLKSSVLRNRVLTIFTLVLSVLALVAMIVCVVIIFKLPRHLQENEYEALSCENLSPPDNGEISVAPGPNPLSRGLGSVATYSCDPGYALVGQTTRTCEDTNGGTVTTGTWSGTSPYCQGVV